ncbi:hypothetical protein HYDPIDRAFT_106713 [Hydnomerulius pinastri MD-312]|nr:hypothetical protein HYDPIDRAFT_106713 [Hydnomerulius pinastri MD-312]
MNMPRRLQFPVISEAEVPSIERPLEELEEIYPDDIDIRKYLYIPHGIFAFTSGHIPEGCRDISNLILDETRGFCSHVTKGTIAGQNLTCILKSWEFAKSWSNFFAELFVYSHPKLLRWLQGDCVPRVIGVYSDSWISGNLSIAMEVPHHVGWHTAHPDMPREAKEAVINVFERIHSQGVMHGDVTLQDILIGDDGRVAIINFEKAACTQALELSCLPRCSPVDLDRELRIVEYLIDYQNAKARERASMENKRGKSRENHLSPFSSQEMEQWDKVAASTSYAEVYYSIPKRLRSRPVLNDGRPMPVLDPLAIADSKIFSVFSVAQERVTSTASDAPQVAQSSMKQVPISRHACRKSWPSSDDANDHVPQGVAGRRMGPLCDTAPSPPPQDPSFVASTGPEHPSPTPPNDHMDSQLTSPPLTPTKAGLDLPVSLAPTTNNPTSISTLPARRDRRNSWPPSDSPQFHVPPTRCRKGPLSDTTPSSVEDSLSEAHAASFSAAGSSTSASSLVLSEIEADSPNTGPVCRPDTPIALPQLTFTIIDPFGATSSANGAPPNAPRPFAGPARTAPSGIHDCTRSQIWWILKRQREANDEAYESAQESRAVSASPYKRRKVDIGSESKTVVFHPDVHDNGLWSTGEHPMMPPKWERRARTPFSENEIDEVGSSETYNRVGANLAFAALLERTRSFKKFVAQRDMLIDQAQRRAILPKNGPPFRPPQAPATLLKAALSPDTILCERVERALTSAVEVLDVYPEYREPALSRMRSMVGGRLIRGELDPTSFHTPERIEEEITKQTWSFLQNTSRGPMADLEEAVKSSQNVADVQVKRARLGAAVRIALAKLRPKDPKDIVSVMDFIRVLRDTRASAGHDETQSASHRSPWKHLLTTCLRYLPWGEGRRAIPQRQPPNNVEISQKRKFDALEVDGSWQTKRARMG